MSGLSKKSLERALKTLKKREKSWREIYDGLSEKEKKDMKEVVVSIPFGDVLVSKKILNKLKGTK